MKPIGQSTYISYTFHLKTRLYRLKKVKERRQISQVNDPGLYVQSLRRCFIRVRCAVDGKAPLYSLFGGHHGEGRPIRACHVGKSKEQLGSSISRELRDWMSRR